MKNSPCCAERCSTGRGGPPARGRASALAWLLPASRLRSPPRPMVLNLRLRGGGGDGGVYPLTHAEQKVRVWGLTNARPQFQ